MREAPAVHAGSDVPGSRFRNVLPFAMISIGVASAIVPSRAADEPTFSIEFKDGVVAPTHLDVPANTRFKLELRNTGTSPAEFESLELRKEKVLAPDSTSILVFRTLDPGTYTFFDDFHPDAPKATLVAK